MLSKYSFRLFPSCHRIPWKTRLAIVSYLLCSCGMLVKSTYVQKLHVCFVFDVDKLPPRSLWYKIFIRDGTSSKVLFDCSVHEVIIVPNRMIVSLVFIVCALLGNTQGAINVFNPSNITEETCSGTRGWTMWFNVGQPKNATSGDSEDMSVILAQNPRALCRIPLAIQAQFINYGTTHSFFYHSIRLHLVMSIFRFDTVAQPAHMLGRQQPQKLICLWTATFVVGKKLHRGQT